MIRDSIVLRKMGFILWSVRPKVGRIQKASLDKYQKLLWGRSVEENWILKINRLELSQGLWRWKKVHKKVEKNVADVIGYCTINV